MGEHSASAAEATICCWTFLALPQCLRASMPRVLACITRTASAGSLLIERLSRLELPLMSGLVVSILGLIAPSASTVLIDDAASATVGRGWPVFSSQLRRRSSEKLCSRCLKSGTLAMNL